MAEAKTYRAPQITIDTEPEAKEEQPPQVKIEATPEAAIEPESEPEIEITVMAKPKPEPQTEVSSNESSQDSSMEDHVVSFIQDPNFNDQPHAAKKQTIEALAQLASVKGMALLREIASGTSGLDRDLDTRVCALEALAARGRDPELALLQRLADDDDPKIAEIARALVKRMAKP